MRKPGGTYEVKRALIACLIFASACSADGRSAPARLFDDDFSSTSTGWRVVEPKTGTARYSHGVLSVLPAVNAGGPAIAVSRRMKTSWTDVAVEATVSWTKPGSEEAGVVCRASGDDARYTFSIGPDGRFDIGKKDRKTSLILLFGEVEAIKRGLKTNRLRAECAGDVLSFYVNDHLLGRVRDRSLKRGTAGVRAAPIRSGGEPPSPVKFDDFEVTGARRPRLPLDATIPSIGQVLFADDFSNSQTNWLGTKGKSEGDGFRAEYSEGRMHFLVTAPSRGISVDSGGVFTKEGRELVDVSDASIEADITLKGGPTDAPSGFYCRRLDPTLQAYYQSFIQPSGQYVIVKWTVEGGKATAHSLVGGFSSIIQNNVGSVNHLRFDCVGRLLRLVVNGKKIAEVMDGSYSAGRVGLVLESAPDLPAPLDVDLDNLVVRELVALR